MQAVNYHTTIHILIFVWEQSNHKFILTPINKTQVNITTPSLQILGTLLAKLLACTNLMRNDPNILLIRVTVCVWEFFVFDDKPT